MTRVAVIIPALNEASLLAGLLEDLRAVPLSLDVTVVDGGSRDDTVSVARAAGARIVSTEAGRATQMNAGASTADAEWLCFLHADVRLPEAAREDFVRAVDVRDTDVAVWRLAIDGRGWWLRTVEYGALVRDRLGGLPYGDQGLIVRRAIFEQLGGFPDIPVLEDVAFVRAVRRTTTIRRLSSPVVVSARRWETEGPYRTWFRNSALLIAYRLGVSPRRLARWYPRHSP